MTKLKNILLIFSLLFSTIAGATYSLSPVPYQQFFDANGDPLNGGFVYTYAAGTLTPLVTYQEADGTPQNQNPVELDSAGRAVIFLSSDSYKFIVKDSAGNTIRTVDGISTQPVGTIDTSSIADDAITTDKIADDAVETAKIADNAVDTSKIADGAVTTDKIEDENVTTAKIKDAAVTSAKLATSVALALNPTGAITAYAGVSAPTGWLLCDGSRVSRSTYSALYAIIGTAFGSGDGSTTFNLPDMRGYFPRGLVNWASKTFSSSDVDTSAETITISGGHGFNRSGFRVRVSSSGSLPTGLSASTTYYVIYVSSTVFKLASTEANAIAGTPINLTGVGSGTDTIVQYMQPDASSRTAQSSGGGTGDNVGSVEEYANAAHTHTLDSYTVATGGSSGAFGDPSSSSLLSLTTASSGGNEARPINVNLNYIIRY